MKYILIFGALSGAIIIAVMMLGILADGGGFFASEYFGYLVMLVALSLIFVGVKRYRDVEQGGVIRFVPAFGIGLGIAAVAGIIYVATWEVYLASTDYAFMDEYVAASIRGLEAEGVTGAAYDRQVAELENMRAQYGNPLFRLPITFFEVFPVGLLVALVSAALLRNPKLLPATR